MGSWLDGKSAHELWDISTANLKEGRPNEIVGQELMRRTDRSPARCEQADREQAERRERMRNSSEIATV